MNDISLKCCTVTHLRIPELAFIPELKQEEPLARWCDKLNPLFRNQSYHFAYGLASEYHR